MKRYYLTSFLLVSLSFTAVQASAPDTVVVAGEQYDRSFVHRLFFGKHYRKAWQEPVRVPFLDFQTEAGGLKPTLKGGSYQTKNLRLVNPKGQEYVLRSVDKDPSQTLSPGIRKSFIGDLLRDQTSVVHPYGSLIVAPLAEAAGILHAKPKLFVVPDDPALGEFREEFANMLVTLEKRADEDQSNTKEFGNSEDVKSSRKMFEKLTENHKNRVNARAFLRARLFDMWIGDWSRREDQWRWASYKTDNGTTFEGIPRDRDHAFFKFNDGIITWLVSLYATNMQSFGPKIKNLEGLNTAAAPLDNSLLVFLPREAYREIGDSLKMQLTDEVIENAVRTWPENIYQLNGPEMVKNLKKRRDQLPEVALDFYELLSENVMIPGSDKKEVFRLTGQKNGLLVEMLKPGKKDDPDSLIVSRLFYPKETKTLKVYGLGGDDTFEIKGEGNPIKNVVLYDGAGQDKVKIEAKEKNQIKFMDSGDGNEFPKKDQLKVINYSPKAEEYTGEGWLLRHRLY